MTAAIVLLEVLPSGRLAAPAAGLLAVAAEVADPVALVAAPADRLDAAAAEAAELGATRVLTAAVDPDRPIVPVVDALAAASARVEADLTLGSNTVDARDALARWAVRARRPLAVDIVGLSRDDEGIVAHHSAFGGAYTAAAAPTFGPFVATVRPGAIRTRLAPQPVSVEPLELVASGHPSARVEAFSPAVAAVERPELRGADTVVAGGRGVGSKEGFALVERLADVLGAAVGASRAAVDAGYATADQQVGQTGVTVSPQLYVALGISGAIQHRAGMQTARVIVAVDTQRDVPIFEIADFGIVGDLFTVVPQLISALEAHKK